MARQNGAEDYKEKIEQATKFNFWISSCPRSVYEEFKELSNKEFADTYHLTLRYLLDSYKKSSREELFGKAVWDVIRVLEDKVEELESKISETKVGDKPLKKTFGKGGEEDE